MQKIIEKLKSWLVGDEVHRDDLKQVIKDLEVEEIKVENLRKCWDEHRKTILNYQDRLNNQAETIRDFQNHYVRDTLLLDAQDQIKNFRERVDELTRTIKDLRTRNEGLSVQKQVLDNVLRTDYIQELKDQIEELNVKLAQAKVGNRIDNAFASAQQDSLKTENLNYKKHYEFRLQKCREYETLIDTLQKELDATHQINAAIIDVIESKKDYTRKLEACLGAHGHTIKEVKNAPQIETPALDKLVKSMSCEYNEQLGPKGAKVFTRYENLGLTKSK